MYLMDQQSRYNVFLEAFRSGDDHTLDLIYQQEEQEKELIQSLLKKFDRFPSKWVKDNKSYYLITVSAKRDGHMQLTYFNNNQPVMDMIRPIAHDKDIINELHDNYCTLETVNYIH